MRPRRRAGGHDAPGGRFDRVDRAIVRTSSVVTNAVLVIAATVGVIGLAYALGVFDVAEAQRPTMSRREQNRALTIINGRLDEARPEGHHRLALGDGPVVAVVRPTGVDVTPGWAIALRDAGGHELAGSSGAAPLNPAVVAEVTAGDHELIVTGPPGWYELSVIYPPG